MDLDVPRSQIFVSLTRDAVSRDDWDGISGSPSKSRWAVRVAKIELSKDRSVLQWILGGREN